MCQDLTRLSCPLLTFLLLGFHLKPTWDSPKGLSIQHIPTHTSRAEPLEARLML